VEMNFPATFRKSNKLDFSVQTSALRSLASSLTCHPFSPAPHLPLTETIPFQLGLGFKLIEPKENVKGGIILFNLTPILSR